jgi:hypothetical protein
MKSRIAEVIPGFNISTATAGKSVVRGSHTAEKEKQELM